jgi:hypothetical protein
VLSYNVNYYDVWPEMILWADPMIYDSNIYTTDWACIDPWFGFNMKCTVF